MKKLEPKVTNQENRHAFITYWSEYVRTHPDGKRKTLSLNCRTIFNPQKRALQQARAKIKDSTTPKK
ncbi:hypothetical protein COT72_03850 [archaeon CG10_big_fil_rev_8_21_14_0_10_43_11]|nr:MAG: hypothetical protein COT72_03850 [archaeon CG10_big_fil_rev_8_21_14_0_10_43_11]